MSAALVVLIASMAFAGRRRALSAHVGELPQHVAAPASVGARRGRGPWCLHRDDLLVGGAVGGVIVIAGGFEPVVAAVGTVVGAAVAVARHRSRRRRRTVEVAAAVPVVLDALSRSLRTGASIRQAVGDVAPVVPPPHDAALAEVAAAAAAGRPLSGSLRLWPARLALPSVVFAVAVLDLCLEVGGPSAPTIDRAAAAIRERLAVDRERDALTSQARLSALVVVAAPLAFGLLPDGAGGSVAGVLLSSPLGWGCLALALVLDAVGWWWMTRLTHPDVGGGAVS